MDRIIRDGWFPDQESVVREALSQFVDAKSFLGDSPRMCIASPPTRSTIRSRRPR